MASEVEKPAVNREKTAKKSLLKEKLKKEPEKKAIDKEPPRPYIDLNDTLSKLSPDEKAIVTNLKDGERLVDDVIAETGMTTGKLLAILTMLELKGIIRRHPGKRISLK